MKIIDIQQGTREWLVYRSTRITGTKFADVLAKPTTQRYEFCLQNIIEARQGLLKPVIDKPWHEHGREWEPLARGLYEWERDVDVQVVGCVEHDKYDFIAVSPDGLIDGGGVEIKCHKSLDRYLASCRKFPAQHKPQVQGTMWVCDCEWWDFVDYYKNGSDAKIHIRRIERDDKYIKRLEESCLLFEEKIQEAMECQHSKLKAS